MAARRIYSDDDKGRVFAALTVNEGNVKRTARELGIPPATVKTWKVEWERNGVPNEVADAAEVHTEAFIADATRIRDKALQQWEQKVDAGDVAARDLMTGVGVLTDKLNTARGLARKDEDTRPQLPPAALREIARGLVEGAVEAAKRRESEIEEAEFIDIEPPALNRGTS